MSNSHEPTELKKEVAELKKQLRELLDFFNIEPVEGQPGRKTLKIECTGLLLKNPVNPDLAQGYFFASEQGPALALWGKDSHARVMIKVEQDKGCLQMFQEGSRQIVDIGLDAKDNPQIGVLHDGKPRAALMATADMGAVSAVHDDGLMRASLVGLPQHGEVFVVGGDMKAAIKLSADGMDGGGYMTVNHANGKGALILSSTRVGGGIISSNSLGQQLAVWPDTKRSRESEED